MNYFSYPSIFIVIYYIYADRYEKNRHAITDMPVSHFVFLVLSDLKDNVKNTLSPSRVTRYKYLKKIHVRANCNIFV